MFYWKHTYKFRTVRRSGQRNSSCLFDLEDVQRIRILEGSGAFSFVSKWTFEIDASLHHNFGDPHEWLFFHRFIFEICSSFCVVSPIWILRCFVYVCNLAFEIAWSPFIFGQTNYAMIHLLKYALGKLPENCWKHAYFAEISRTCHKSIRQRC